MGKFLVFTFLFLILIIKTAFAQAPFPAGSRAAALADASLLISDAWSVHNNSAAMTGVKELQIGLWTERKFNIKELTNGAFSIVLPTKKSGVLGLGFYQYGGTTFLKQQKYTFAYALPLSEKVSAGIGLSLINTHIDFYGSQFTALGEAGIIYQINPETKVGISVWNPAPVKFAAYQEEKLPTIFRGAISRKISKNLMLLGEAEKEINQKTAFKIAIDYKPDPKIELQAGLRTYPLNYSFGAGFGFSKIKLHLAFVLFQVLGPTPHASFEYINYKNTAEKDGKAD